MVAVPIYHKVFGTYLLTFNFKQNEGCCLKADADIIILLPEPKLGTIVHESFHAADMILRDRDVELIGNGEAYAYLIEYIVTKITQ